MIIAFFGVFVLELEEVVDGHTDLKCSPEISEGIDATRDPASLLFEIFLAENNVGDFLIEAE